MLLSLRTEVIQIDLAILRALDDYDLHTRHDGAGGVRTMRGRWNQTNVTVMILAVLVIRADDEETRILSLSARVRLQRGCSEARDLGQPPLEFAKDHPIPLSLIGRSKRVQLSSFRPGHTGHLRGRVQFHRA